MPNGRGEFFYGNGEKALDKYVGDFVDGAVSPDSGLKTLIRIRRRVLKPNSYNCQIIAVLRERQILFR